MSKYAKQCTSQQTASFWQNKKKPLLKKLDIELTERCNLDCIHCCINQPANDKKIQAREMSSAQVKDILDQAADLGCLTVRFTGGEPLLRSDFTELYLHARRLGMRVQLFTNATLLSPDLADLLARIPPLQKIEITVYGMSGQSYAAVTGRQNAYQTAMRGINLLLERKIPFIVKGALLPPNQHEIATFDDWAATIPWMENRPPAYAMFFDLRVRRDRLKKQRRIQQLRLSPQAGQTVLTRHGQNFQGEMNQFCKQFLSPPGKNLFTCGACLEGCVDAYGQMQPCMLLRHPDTVWSLKKFSVLQVLTDFFPRLRQLKASNPDYLSRCGRCLLRGLCEQCPAKSWMEHGTLDTPVAYLCRLAHYQARTAGLLPENIQGWEIEKLQL